MKKILFSILAVALSFILILVVNYIIFQKTVNSISQGEPIIQSDPVKPALLVIDVQEGTTGKYSNVEYYKTKSRQTITTINLLADSSR